MEKLQSPLRYPGGKKKLAFFIEKVIISNSLTNVEFYEPYAGGAGISMHLLSNKIILKTTLVEKDPLIYAFWKELKTNTDELCRRIDGTKINLETWKIFQKYLQSDVLKKYDRIDLAVACLFLNRTNFSGILNAGPIGGMYQKSKYLIDCRFSKSKIIENIKEIAKYKKQISVVYSDAIEYLKKNSNRINERSSLVYLDPPYYSQGKRLYRFYYTDNLHEQLTKYIQKQIFPWIVSYDNHPFIIGLFKGQRVIPISMNSTVKKYRKFEELIISNIELIPEKEAVRSKCGTELEKRYV